MPCPQVICMSQMATATAACTGLRAKDTSPIGGASLVKARRTMSTCHTVCWYIGRSWSMSVTGRTAVCRFSPLTGSIAPCELTFTVRRTSLWTVTVSPTAANCRQMVLTPQVSILDRQGHVLARWDSRSAHGLWVDCPRGYLSGSHR